MPIQDDDSIFAEIDLGDYSFRYETDSSFNTILYNEINVYHKVGDLFFWGGLNKKVLSINEILAPDDKLTDFGWNYLLYDLKERPDFIKSKINTMIKDIQKYIKPIFNSTQLLLYPDSSGLEDYLELIHNTISNNQQIKAIDIANGITIKMVSINLFISSIVAV